MKIDIFNHIFPSKLRETLLKLKPSLETHRQLVQNTTQPALWDMDYRCKMLSEYENVVQVLTIAEAPFDLLSHREANDIVKIGNNEMAEIISKYPHQFIAGVATLPQTDIDAMLNEMDRGIKELGFKGVQLTTNINGKSLDSPEFMPLYEKMADYDLPIWIHPHRSREMSDYQSEAHSKYGIHGLFGWPYETAVAMTRLIFSGILDKYPNLKFITHHCGGKVPFFEQRIRSWYDLAEQDGLKGEKEFIQGLAKRPVEYFKMFYNDTALYGSTPALMCGFAFFGAEHILFGTDMPFDKEHGHRHLRETIQSVERMGISDSDKEKIFEQNVRKLLRSGETG